LSPIVTATGIGMSAGAPCRLDAAGDSQILRLAGDWRLPHLAALDGALAALPRLPASVKVDGAGLAELDTAAALLLALRLRDAGLDPAKVPVERFSASHARVLDLVRGRLAEIGLAPAPVHHGWLARVGRAAFEIWRLVKGHINFLGLTVSALAATLLRPASLRLKELTVQLEAVCLNAIPVVALVTALIGVVFAYLLGMQATQYGANIFVVDGVAIGMTRELAPMLVAVIMAGRSGAAFTAQLGTMKLTEEIDAIRTLGLSPVEVLVLPRMLALMIAMPLLTFVGDVASIGGAMLVAGPMLDITPAMFIDRLHRALATRHVIIGLVKAPVFAMFIAVIGCRMGMDVSRDTRAIGTSTTSTVVQCIVAVILLNAAFAVTLQALGW
jgi:phospholipid/cholesterol/gamma-HCH transport system permease protein